MSGYIGTQPVPQATQHREAFTATASQTSFATAGYTPQFVDVYLNGVKLAAADYTATNGSDIVLTTGAALNDILEYVAYTPFEVASQTFTGTTTADALTVTGAFTSKGIDDNATSTAMTLDGSGNVLVGKTVNDLNTQGVRIRSNALDVSRDNSTPLNVNRNNTDGTLAIFYKDGTTVGSIGTYANEYYHGSAVGGDTFLRHGYSGIVPATSSGTNRDAAIQLGSSVSRFKDLYLSGGVYLGGTGAANKLDDYESGTFTPVVGSSGGGSTTAGAFSGRYTKVGNLVTVNFHCTNFTFSGGSGNLELTGFPFTPVELSSRPTRGGNVVFYRYDLPDTGYGYVVPEVHSSGIMVFRVPVDDQNWVPVEVENGSSLYVEGVMTYFTDS